MTSTTAVPRAWNLRGLSVVSFAHGVSDFYSGIVPFTIFLVLSRQHVSPAYQGAFVFLWYLTSSIVQPFFGAYTDRHGRWWFLPGAIALTVVAVSVAGTTTALPLLAACIVVGGFGSALMHPEAGKYSAMLSGARRASGISIFQVGGQVGYALGPAAIALLYARFGTGGAVWLFVPGAIAVAYLFAVMRRVDRSAERFHASVPVKSAAAGGRVDRVGVSLLLASTALRHFVSAAFMTYLPNLLVARGSSIPEAGQIVTAFLLISSVGLLAVGSLRCRTRFSRGARERGAVSLRLFLDARGARRAALTRREHATRRAERPGRGDRPGDAAEKSRDGPWTDERRRLRLRFGGRSRGRTRRRRRRAGARARGRQRDAALSRARLRRRRAATRGSAKRVTYA